MLSLILIERMCNHGRKILIMAEYISIDNLIIQSGLIYGFPITDAIELTDGQVNQILTDAYGDDIARKLEEKDGAYRGAKLYHNGYVNSNACTVFIGIEIPVNGETVAPALDSNKRNIIDDLAHAMSTTAGYHIITPVNTI